MFFNQLKKQVFLLHALNGMSIANQLEMKKEPADG
jgi:hypothetical protein